MANVLVSHNINYRSIVMSSKDFITFTEILDRSKVVNSQYVGDETVWVVDDYTNVTCELVRDTLKVMSRKEYEALKEKGEAQ